MKLERAEVLQARPHERTDQRTGHANGFKHKTVNSRIGNPYLRVPQTRDVEFYPSTLERGERSERALKLSVAEMYVQGVSTRKVAEITEQLCGLDVSSRQVYFITKYRLSKFKNPGTHLRRIIQHAGLKPWPKPWQNMRATRATELAREYLGHVAAAWLGHSVQVAQEHYWQVTEADFERAAMCQICSQQEPATRRTEPEKAPQERKKPQEIVACGNSSWPSRI